MKLKIIALALVVESGFASCSNETDHKWQPKKRLLGPLPDQRQE